MADRISSDRVAQDQILAFVQRIERIESDVKELNSDKAEIFAEAKGNGFDVKALKIVIARRRMDLNERMELEAIVELYESALGMYVAPPQDEEDYQPRARARAHVENIDEFDADGVVQEFAPPSNGADAQPMAVPAREDRPPASLASHEAEHSTVSSADFQREPASVPLVSDPLSDADAQRLTAGPLSHEPDSPAFAEAGTPDSPASNSLGSAADKSGSGGVSPALPAPRTHNPETHFLTEEGLLRLHGCQGGRVCGSSQPRVKLCFSCSTNHDGPTFQPEASIH